MALKMPAPKMYIFILNFEDMVEILVDSLKPAEITCFRFIRMKYVEWLSNFV